MPHLNPRKQGYAISLLHYRRHGARIIFRLRHREISPRCNVDWVFARTKHNSELVLFVLNRTSPDKRWDWWRQQPLRKLFTGRCWQQTGSKRSDFMHYGHSIKRQSGWLWQGEHQSSIVNLLHKGQWLYWLNLWHDHYSVSELTQQSKRFACRRENPTRETF